MKRTASGKDEPEQKKFEVPSEKEHLFQCVDVFDKNSHPDNFDLSDPDIVFAKLEVVGGDEEGRGILNRMSLDDKFKGFFATRLFLKAIGEEYKGDNFPIDTEEWIGKQMYATVIHDGKYANIDKYNFDKPVEQAVTASPVNTDGKTAEEVVWDE